MNPRLAACMRGVSALAAFLCLSSEILAQTGDAAAPPASRGFQLAVRGGYSFPLGEATGGQGDYLSDAFGHQTQFTADLGGKPWDSVFLGAYIGGGAGYSGDAWRTRCSFPYTESPCIALSARTGAQVHYQFLPDQRLNPWIGYGIGREFVRLSGEGNGHKTILSGSGLEFAHLMAGLDLRRSEFVGVGLFVDVSIGQFDTQSIEIDGVKESGEIDRKAMHRWLTLGFRALFWP